ncbi:MAG: hypothetical protein HY698_20140 [Deltaproteobacteria bacterium]|nr:hypothetical protein [Deltaproteobacteria bacterium]
MTTHRPADFSLAKAVGSRSFTPRRSDVPVLLALLAEEDDALQRDVELALARIHAGPHGEDSVVKEISNALQVSKPPLRGRLARALGRLCAAVDSAAAREALLALCFDEDQKTQRNAVIALGKLRPGLRVPSVEDTLLRLWARPLASPLARSVAEALGKVGGEPALVGLHAARTDDAELRKALDKAILILTRTLGRTETKIDLGVPPLHPILVDLHCRPGLEPWLMDELRRLGAPQHGGHGTARLLAEVPPVQLFESRVFTRLGFPLSPRRGSLEEAVATALASEEAHRILATWTRGTIRYRLHWIGGGHRRALAFRVAQLVSARAPELVNDPTESPWVAMVRAEGGYVHVELVPRVPDPRFTYRQRDVPGASHPTLAAALVRAAGARADDIVWDPFAGAATELIERARAGPYKELHGTDLDPRALEAAAGNLAAAGIAGVKLERADARTHVVPGVSLVLTNPPMGRRVLRGDVGPLLDEVVGHVAKLLHPKGRFAWYSPLPRRTAASAVAVGLTMVTRREVDMGGFTAELQVFRL